jgi:hypothetical protein
MGLDRFLPILNMIEIAYKSVPDPEKAVDCPAGG